MGLILHQYVVVDSLWGTHMHTHMHTYIHTHTHACTQTHTHTHILTLLTKAIVRNKVHI